MKTEWGRRVTSLTLSLLLIAGGLTVTGLLIVVSYGPGFPEKPIVRNIIIVYTSVSYLTSGVLGAIACFYGHKSWLYGLHISLEVLFLLFSGIGFITLHKTMKIYFEDDCSPINSTCICKGTDLKSTCDLVFKQENLVAMVNILDVITWLILFFDFIISAYLSFCFEKAASVTSMSDRPPGDAGYKKEEPIHKLTALDIITT